MGGVHLRNWQALDGAQVVAVCDKSPEVGKATQGNIDAGQEVLDLEGMTLYSDVAEMLAGEKLDAVSITLPTHLHKAISIQCLEAGVHVLCEKPMALNTADCDAMIASASKAGRYLMVAHCIRFWPEYVWAKQAVQSGEYGKVLSADFSRLTYAPAWDGDSWLSDPAKSGGIALDLHIHDLDFIQYLFGAPAGSRSVRSTFKHVQTWLDYGDDRVISATASWLMPESFGFQMAFKIVFETAASVYDGTTLTVYPSEGSPYEPEVGDGMGYAGEIEYFAALISGTNTEAVITPEQARESVRMALETNR
ncbi:1,5-anhydro-D-fructose reductase [Pontiella sulfatireligans]|uniref:1,5-anhydro-D-fructose reductase n=2 Tax=Pontiella sulfatireligans TaxID=2750658 RepID=A0A6C2UJU7_9BACT|nr:1,5-anhydro-D-fructose reductase [Pontiella sulfatireligans]